MIREIQSSFASSNQALTSPSINGTMGDKDVSLERKNTKSASVFRKTMQLIGSFVFRSVKFSAKTLLFITGVSALIAITRCFWSLMKPKQEKTPIIEDSLQKRINLKANTSSADLHINIQKIISQAEQQGV
jgi:hypothetical protein